MAARVSPTDERIALRRVNLSSRSLSEWVETHLVAGARVYGVPKTIANW
jgi:hypothetical protein